MATNLNELIFKWIKKRVDEFVVSVSRMQVLIAINECKNA